VTVGDHDPADDPSGEWLDLRPIVRSRLNDPRVKARIAAPYRVSSGYDVPYVCGISVSDDELFADLHCPIAAAPIGKGNAPVNLVPFIWLHECGEKSFVELFGDIYMQAHKLITIAEHDEVVGAGLNWYRYSRFFDAYDRSTERETLQRVPRKLFMRPYTDSGDWLLVNRMQAAMAAQDAL
jgi:hypothetical protein